MPNCTRFTVRSGALESVVDIVLLSFAQNREIQSTSDGNFPEPARTKSKRRGIIFSTICEHVETLKLFLSFCFFVSGKKKNRDGQVAAHAY